MKKPEDLNSKKKLFLVGQIDIKGSKLADRQKSHWVEETFIDYSDDEINRGNKNYMGASINARLLNILFVFMVSFLCLFFGRSAYMQIINGDEYLQLAEHNRLRIYHLQSPRGLIFDRNYDLLVTNTPNLSVYITAGDFPKNDPEKSDLKNTINQLTELDLTEKLNAILAINSTKKEYYQPQILENNLDYEKAVNLIIESAKMPGVTVEVNNQRSYLKNSSGNTSFFYNSSAHLLGYVGKISPDEFLELADAGYLYRDNVGKTGLEKSYEEILRGKYGIRQVEVDSMGKEKKVIAQSDVQKGDNIVLTIDYTVQEKLEDLIRSTLIKNNLTRGIGIVQNPTDGEILAMVSLPSYDNNLFAGGIKTADYEAIINQPNNPLFNRAINGEYPSGSVIKPIIAVAALQEKVITEKTTFLSVGGLKIESWFFPDWRAGGHGLTNVRKALADSVNTFFYIIGGGYRDFKGLGIYKIKEYGEKFGLNKITGVDLPNENSGFLPSPEWKIAKKGEDWYIGDTYHASIGQGDVLVTPLQVSNYMSAFANQGILYKPRLVKSIIDSTTGYEKKILPEVLNANFIDSYNLEVVRQGLRQTVTAGSAKSLSNLPVTVAGKTGTAQWSTTKKNHAWFSGFAPYNNPEITITILFEEAGEGSDISVPVAYDFLNWYFTVHKNN